MGHMMVPITCTDPSHASRSAEADWSERLGETSGPVVGYLCGACARLRPTESVDAVDTPEMELRADGNYAVHVQRVYQTGEVVEVRRRRQTLSNFLAQYGGLTNAGQRQAFRDALRAMAEYARDNPL